MDDKTFIVYKELKESKVRGALSKFRQIVPKPSFVSLIVCLSLLTLLILFPFLQKENITEEIPECLDICKLSLVESVPDDISLPKLDVLSTYNTWKKLIDQTKMNISIASSYWTLRSNEISNDTSSWMGQSIFDSLYDASLNRGIDLRIVQNYAKVSPDTSILAQSANAKVRKLNFRKFSKYGILHTKLWIFDDTHFYVGSANMDWRSLSQVKEMGLVAENCSCLARDVRKIFESYWYLSDPALASTPNGVDILTQTDTQHGILSDTPRPVVARSRSRRVHRDFIKRVNRDVLEKQEDLKNVNIFPEDLLSTSLFVPDVWPDTYTATYNLTQPAMVHSVDGNAYDIYLSSSPALLNGKSRTNDIDAILNAINEAQEFVYISVMEYMPGTLYLPKFQYWSLIDEALKQAAFNRNVKVRLLISWWEHSNKHMLGFLKSLIELSQTGYADIEIKIFILPKHTPDIPFSRVNHNKIMVTETTAYIGTSNWSADYFIWTGGIGIIVKPRESHNDLINDPVFSEILHLVNNKIQDSIPNIRNTLENVFLRDWNSKYSAFLQNFTLY